MRKKELIKALSKIEEGIADVKNLLLADEQNASTPEVSSPASKDETVEGRFSKEDLDAMKYNDLKKLGKELGVKCTGTREEITERILGVPIDVPMNEPEEEEEPAKEEKSKVVPMNKKSKATKKEEPEEDDDEIEEQYLEMAREALEDNSLEDVIEVLAEAGIKLTAMQKKKQDVVMTKLAEAFQNGMIDTEDDDEEETDEEESVEEEEGELEFSEDSYFENYDPEGVNDPSNMTKKRAKAVKSLVSDIISKFEEEELTTDDIESELEDIVTDEDLDLLGEDYSEEELLAFYIEMKKKFIDNDGNVCDPSEPYEIGDYNYCCGHELVFNKKGNKYVCPVCKEEYDEE